MFREVVVIVYRLKLHTVVVRKAESAIITELVTSNGLVVAVAHSTSV